MTVRTETYTAEEIQDRLAELRALVSDPAFAERQEANVLLPREQALLDEIEDLEYLCHGLPAAC